VIPSTGLITSEAGGTASFSVILTSRPRADVIISFSSSDPGEGTVSPVQLLFTEGNWNMAQQVTVRGVDDFIADGNQPYIINITSVSGDSVYNGFDVTDLSLININDDTPGVIVNPTDGLTTTEAGGTDSFTILLNSEPTANVIINLISSNTEEGTVSPSSITFTKANWNIPQELTLSGVDDFIADGDQPYIINTTSVSSDSVYNVFDVTDVSVTNINDDVPGVTVNPTSGLTTTEAGGTAVFTVFLHSQPLSTVTIMLDSSDTGEGTVSKASLTFTPANWDIVQPVTVIGVDDFIADSDKPYIIEITSVSGDSAYNGFDVTDVSVTNINDDVPGITVNPTSGLTTTEAGGIDVFTVFLKSQPLADVNIMLESSNTNEGTVSPSKLSFTPGRWNIPQQVITRGVGDFIADGDQTYKIKIASVSVDSAYNGFDVTDVSAININDDFPGVTVNPTSGLWTIEYGSTATFTVTLNSQPTSDVTISLKSSDNKEGSVSPKHIVFTPSNWDSLKEVTVTGENDNKKDGNQGYSILTLPAESDDPMYQGMEADDVSLTNSDDETPGVTINQTSGLTTTESGGTAIFTVVLNTEPDDNVTVGLFSSDTNEGKIFPLSLSFNPTNWNKAQEVTITGVNDFIADGDQTYTIFIYDTVSTDSDYHGLDPFDVSVTNIED
jgi:hypothetical protein